MLSDQYPPMHILGHLVRGKYPLWRSPTTRAVIGLGREQVLQVHRVGYVEEFHSLALLYLYTLESQYSP